MKAFLDVTFKPVHDQFKAQGYKRSVKTETFGKNRTPVFGCV